MLARILSPGDRPRRHDVTACRSIVRCTSHCASAIIGARRLNGGDSTRLAVTTSLPKQGCGAEVELIEARTGNQPANVFGVALGGILPTPPHHLHLREMLTLR